MKRPNADDLIDVARRLEQAHPDTDDAEACLRVAKWLQQLAEGPAKRAAERMVRNHVDLAGKTPHRPRLSGNGR